MPEGRIGKWSHSSTHS